MWENMTAVFFSFMKSNVPHHHHMVLHSQFLSQEDGKRLLAEVVLSGHIVDGESSSEDDVGLVDLKGILHIFLHLIFNSKWTSAKIKFYPTERWNFKVKFCTILSISSHHCLNNAGLSPY